MLRPRIIPCLLVHQGGLVKTVEFKDPKYVGDPINAVRIFNEKEADELIVLDIDATVKGAEPDYRMIANLAAECRMPLCYGGGVRTPEQAKKIIGLGVEKIAMSTAAVEDATLVSRTADAVGRQSVVVVLDVRRKAGLFASGYEVFTGNGKKAQSGDPFKLAERMQAAGAGEIIINSIERDGQMKGYDLALATRMRRESRIPLTLLGGAGSHHDLEALLGACGVVGASAGSLFVFKGPYRAVLINYPTPEQKDAICRAGLASYSLS
ncbi:AglZ/HisF2 family acetamidino modification protein [Accumulibacter sp.]|uniref:AglZ/HisF2 family acetamidino modification protein n=1 Tax=Accumulibacter sp. TaxID=2053492 RepID=UPI0028C4215B|nr:AglZ/HisF2 family acetamidino modification protein [Accumulibacter sp.]